MEKLKFPIHKHELAKKERANVHYNTIARWCKWAEPELIRIGYKRRNKMLTKKEYKLIRARARFKYILMNFKELPTGEHVPIGYQKRVFNNKFLFPFYPEFITDEEEEDNEVKEDDDSSNH